MNTKEAIEWIQSVARADVNEQTDASCDNIIKLLQRGEKFEKIFRDLEIEGNASESFGEHLRYIRRKYFTEEEQVLILTITGEKTKVNEKTRDIKNYFKDTMVDVKEGTRGMEVET